MSKGKKFLKMTTAVAFSAQLLGVSLLLLGLACNKSNPVSSINNNSGTMSDADGNVYQTVKIGNQEWMAENLRVTKYNDGTAIPHIIESTAWDSCQYSQIGAYCYFSNTTNADSIKKFGALYNWYTVNTKKLATAGWHVPTDSEWTILEKYLALNGYNWDGTTDTSVYNYNKIAKSLAAKTDWYSDTFTGTIGKDLSNNNSSGFSALPGSYRTDNGYFDWYGIGYYGYWWSATEGDDASYAYIRELVYNYDNIVGDYEPWTQSRGGDYYKSCGFSVRLLKDN